MPVVPWVRPSQGSVQAPAKGTARRVLQFAGGFGNESADLPVAGVEAERDGSAVGGAEAAVRAEDEELGVEDVGRVPTHADVLLRPKRLPEGWVSSISAVMGRTPEGPGAWVATALRAKSALSRTEVRDIS